MYIYVFPIQQAAAAAGYVTPLSNIAVALPLTLVCAVVSWHLIEAPPCGCVIRHGEGSGRTDNADDTGMIRTGERT